MRTFSTFLLLILFSVSSYAQINAKLMRYMDVSDSHITFVYGGDIWLVDKNGGTAMQVTHSPGEESWPRFSPDGTEIAFTASYNGNQDVYVMPVNGGIPHRVTYQSHADRMVEWHPDGERLMFASRRHLGQRSSNQFFLVSKNGGLPEVLPIPYGELGSFSPDGSRLAYITKITENYPFKRYKGGLASDIILFDLNSNTAENITENEFNDGKPAWAGDKVYFLSDQGPNFRLNVWSYDTNSEVMTQITNFTDFDISFLSAGPDDLVFEVGGELYLMDLATQEYGTVDVNVVSDLSSEMKRTEDVSNMIQHMTASPGGKRVVFEARGELFSVPVTEGYTANLTQSSGAFDRHPSWSPDGKNIAYWSDRDGEYEIWLQPVNGNSAARKLTDRNMGYGYTLNWSPDSKHLAFIDETNTIYTVNAESGRTAEIGNTNWNVGHGGRDGFPISWSPDSRWISFSRGMENGQFAVMLYDTDNNELHQATSSFYDSGNAVFSSDGNYMFFQTSRNFSAAYSDLDDTWVYPNTTHIVAVSLTGEAPYLLHPKNDEAEVADGEGNENDDDGDEEEMNVEINIEGLESRIAVLPIEPGNFGSMVGFFGESMLVYVRFPNTGSGGGAPSLMAYDTDKREEVTIMEGVGNAVASADGKSILVSSRGQYGIIQPQPGQKIEDGISTESLKMDLVPKEEWRQIFRDTWRRHRDFFYDPDMHGVDWEELGERYGALIDDARTRWDITNLQSNLVAELSAGHTYSGGGDTENVNFIGTGYLGIDWEMDNGKYRIARIIKPAEWDTEVRSPFDRPGVNVNTGDYIHSVNGMMLDPAVDPYAPFEGLDGKTVSLMVSSNGNIADSEEVIVETLSQGEEAQLRYLEWIENNRKMVDELSDGKLGYVYMSNTGGQGQLELVRMYYGQLDKEGFIIDERFNGGGQLADRFLELMQRPIVYNLHWRHGRDHRYPIKANTGPMGMLINGWAGSGGDGLPWAFQELEAGPIVGERTLGILVGPATGHQLIDGGGITVPGARLYDNDGHWFWEGEGVRPDIKVWDDPNQLIQGRDPQMERVVAEVMRLLQSQGGNEMTPAPKPDDRSASGLKDN